MIKIIPFKKEHLDCMEMREHERGFVVEDEMAAFEGCAFTGIIEGRIISCGGLLLEKGGNAYLWQIPSVYVHDVKLSYCKYIRKWIDDVSKEFCLNRLESLCVDDELHNRWMGFLGFQKEGVKRRFYNGQDYAMFGRLV